jgi:regulator of replication initiation timing
VLQGKYDETRAALQMMTDENLALKIECETYKKDLGALRRENERLKKELRAAKAAKEGTSSNP